MAQAFRKPLGMALQNAILPGDQPNHMPPGLGLPAPQQPKGGFFREGGMGRTLAGMIGDVLLQQADMAPVYAPMLRQKQQTAQEEAQWTRRREADNQDWRARQDYERANPAPRAPYRFQDNAGNLVEIGPDGQPKTVFKDPTPKTTYITAENGDGTKTIIPVINGVPQMGGRPQGPAAAPGAPRLGPVVDSVPGGPPARPAGTFR